MGRSTRKTVVLAKLETVPGTGVTPVNTTDAVLLRIEDMNIRVEQQFADRDIVRGLFGAPDKLPYVRRGSIQFSVDGASAGAAGSALPYGVLLQACGFAETLSAGVSATYNTVSSGLKSLSIWAYKDGEELKFNFCTGTVTADFSVASAPKLTFTFQALVTSVAANTNPVPTLTMWKRPFAVGPLNTSAMKLGATLVAGVLTGGTAFNFKTFNLDLANDVQFDDLASASTVGIYNRSPTLTMVLDLTVAAEVQKYTDMAAGTATSIGFDHGTGAGNILTWFLANAVITGVADNVDGNKLLSELTFSLQDSAAFNDSVQLVAK